MPVSETKRIENDCTYRGYKTTVKQKASGEILVTLTHHREGHTFEGSNKNGYYDRALAAAYTRMTAYEDRK